MTIKVPFSKFVVLVEDPDFPGQFRAPCGFESRALKINKDLVETTIPDCDDEDAAVWTQRVANTKSMEITGEGAFAAEDQDTWRKFSLAPGSWNCKVMFKVPGSAGGGEWAGKFILTPFEMTAQRQNHLMFSMTLLSDGAITWTAAA